jgi:flagellar motility protein MotE (MotC chaperone)
MKQTVTRMRSTRLGLAAALAAQFVFGAALAAEKPGSTPPAKVTGTAVPATSASAPADNATLYCRNIANPAADARYARQADALADMQKALDDRIAALEKKRAEYEEWVTRRQQFLSRADESVVAIYSQMRPDAAAQQIAVMEEEAAAAILSKLAPRTASAILNEMDAAIAAHLTNVMAGLPADERKAGAT